MGNGVAFSGDGSQVASCSGDEPVRIWDVASGECRATLEGHTGGVNGVAFSGDGSQVASCSGDEPVRIWDVASGECRATLEGHTGSVYGVAFSGDGSQVASCSGDETCASGTWRAELGNNTFVTLVNTESSERLVNCRCCVGAWLRGFRRMSKLPLLYKW